MTLLVVLALIVAGWAARHAVGLRTERTMLERLPLGPDGVIEGAGGLVREGSSERAVLVLHGFGDTPQTLHYLVDHLHGLGFTVHAPLLPGHGRTLAEFARTDADAWLASADREFTAVRGRFGFVGLVGVSMGGALAVVLAARTHPDPNGPQHGGLAPDAHGPDTLVLLAPYLSMRSRARRLAVLHWVVSPFARYLPSREEGSIRDPVERSRNRGFGTVTPGLLHELRRVVGWAQEVLPSVRQPTLVIQSRDDNRIETAAAAQSFDALGSSEKRLVWTEGSGHVLTVDTGRDQVLGLTGDWLVRTWEDHPRRTHQ